MTRPRRAPRRRRLAALVGVAVVAAAAAGGALYEMLRAPDPVPERMVLLRADYGELEGWRNGDFLAARAAFRRSCGRFAGLADDRPLSPSGVAGRIRDWRAACAALDAVADGDAEAVRRYFEAWFVPLAVADNDRTDGLFTGYYEAQLRGSRHRHGPYTTPLYARPPDLVMVDLGRFREDLRGRRIAGRVVDGRLRPFASRAEIEAGALANRDLEMLWVDDRIGAFFLHIQGSGQVLLDDGEIARIGYAGHNGHPYFAIGRELIARGALDRESVSLQSIRAWLEAHPDLAAEVMNRNRSYIFFRRIAGEGPIGAFQVPLTPRASLAVDRRYIPLGVPVWLETALPRAGAAVPWRQLLVAQDTGGAIRGIVRGDIFFGAGPEAEAVAGRLKHPGRYYILLPRAVVERGDPWPAGPTG